MADGVLIRLIHLFPPFHAMWPKEMQDTWWRLFLDLWEMACEAESIAAVTPFNISLTATGHFGEESIDG